MARNDASSTGEIWRRSRGAPRVANRLLLRVRDYAQIKADGAITEAVARDALVREGVDARGLDKLDRRFLEAIVDVYGGGPVGLEAGAATIHHEAGTPSGDVRAHPFENRLVPRQPPGPPGTPAAL